MGNNKTMMNGKKGGLLILSFVALVGTFTFVLVKYMWSDDSKAVITVEDKNNLFKSPATTKTSVPTTAASSQMATSVPTQESADSSQSQPASVSAPTENTTSENTDSSEKKEDEKKTFTSDKLKVSFDYSGDLNITEGINLITVKNGDKSWKIRFYDNKKKEDIEPWFKDKFDDKDNTDCSFLTSDIKVGSYTGQLVKKSSDSGKCDDEADYALSSDKLRMVKVDPGEETKEDINKVLENFKFL